MREDVREFDSSGPENRESIAIIQNINAAGDYPMLVIQGHDIKMSWFADELPMGTKVMNSENGFTADKTAIDYLSHYILNSDAGPDNDWKLMLMDHHGSHCTPEFILLANLYDIRPLVLIPQLFATA